MLQNKVYSALLYHTELHLSEKNKLYKHFNNQRLDIKTKHLSVVFNMSKDWQLRSGSLVTGHLLAVKIQTEDNFYATSKKRKQFHNKFLKTESIFVLSFKNK